MVVKVISKADWQDIVQYIPLGLSDPQAARSFDCDFNHLTFTPQVGLVAFSSQPSG